MAQRNAEHSTESVQRQEKRAFSIEDVVANANKNESFDGTWVSETEIFFRSDDALQLLDVLTGKINVIAKDPVFNDSNNQFFPSFDGKFVLVQTCTQKVYRHSSTNLYSIYNVSTKTLTKVEDGEFVSTAVWSPVENVLAYVYNNDIYWYHIEIGENSYQRLTFDGKPQGVYNGVPDWVYEEDVLGTNRAMWFSPTGRYLAFAKFNDSDVLESVIERYGKPGTRENQYPQQEKFRYPKAGTKNPDVTLNIIDLRADVLRPVALKTPTIDSEEILCAGYWLDANTLGATWTNRIQNKMEIVSYAINKRRTLQTLLTREVSDGWLLHSHSIAAPILYEDCWFILKCQSIGEPRVGLFAHVTRYRMQADGCLGNELDLTPGKLWAHAILGVNEGRKVVYFLASPPDQPSRKHLYEVSVDGSSPPKCISDGLKTPEGNECRYVSSVNFSPKFTRYALVCAGPDPAFIDIYDDESNKLHAWMDNKDLRQLIAGRSMPYKMDLEVEANGINAKVRLVLPDDFDSSKKYPMIVHVYAGPDSQMIDDKFKVGFEKYIASNKKWINAWIDGRGTFTKGTAILYAVNRNLGHLEMDDQIAVTKFDAPHYANEESVTTFGNPILTKNLASPFHGTPRSSKLNLQNMFSWIDRDRTGVWGRSYGGYATLRILIKDDENVFRCGVSVAPVTHWYYYDTVYTERYMGIPAYFGIEAPNYDSSSVIHEAEKLNGKKFMLIHGTADDNVHYQQSMALAKTLVEKDVLFHQFTYPDEAHALTNVLKHFYRTMDVFFTESFRSIDETRSSNL